MTNYLKTYTLHWMFYWLSCGIWRKHYLPLWCNSIQTPLTYVSVYILEGSTVVGFYIIIFKVFFKICRFLDLCLWISNNLTISLSHPAILFIYLFFHLFISLFCVCIQSSCRQRSMEGSRSPGVVITGAASHGCWNLAQSLCQRRRCLSPLNLSRHW